HAHLVLAEAKVVVDGRAEAGEHAVAPRPLLGEDAEAAVAEEDRALAPAERAEEFRQRGDGAAELRDAGELEPVHARADLEPQGARRAIRRPARLDVPAVPDKRAARAGQVARRQIERGHRPPAGVGGVLAEAELPEPRQRRPLGGAVARDEAAAVGLEDAA